MNYVPTRFEVVENWYTDNWDKVADENITGKMRRIFKDYVKLYNVACDLTNPKLGEWNKAYKADYDVEYEKYIARLQNEIFSKVKKLNKSIKIRSLIIPEDNVSVVCGITMIEGVRYICAASLKAVYD